MTTWFTSDTHAFHKNICKGISTWGSGVTRDFDCEVKMTEQMAQKINSRVKTEDTLFHLGDWSFGGKDKIKKFREMINCNHIHLIYGNHDHKIIDNYDNCHSLFESVQFYLEKRFNGVTISMFHRALGVWEDIGKGGINLFGHSHGSYSRIFGKQMDVGVDTNGLKPYSLDEIFYLMNQKEIILVDHHNAESNSR